MTTAKATPDIYITLGVDLTLLLAVCVAFAIVLYAFEKTLNIDFKHNSVARSIVLGLTVVTGMTAIVVLPVAMLWHLTAGIAEVQKFIDGAGYTYLVVPVMRGVAFVAAVWWLGYLTKVEMPTVSDRIIEWDL